MLADVQTLIFIVLAVVAFGLQAFALVDALRRPAGSFVAAGKRTKNFWLAILVIAAAVGFISLPFPGLLDPFNFLNLIAVVAAAVYLTDVRPAVRQIRGGGGGHSGPYGPW